MTSISVREYFADRGSSLSNEDARVIGPVLQELALQGGVTTRDVVDAARTEQSPLHSYFEWNDKVAADLHRLEQARYLMRSVRVRFVENEEVRETRAFHVTQVARNSAEPRKYRTFQVLHGDSAFAVQMLDNAFDDLQAWKRKYEPYTGIWENFGDAFQHVVNQASEWADEYAAHALLGETDDALARLLLWREECGAAIATWTAAREQMEFILKAIVDAETIFAKVSEKKDRNCLKCFKPFVSVSASNRICKSCLNAKTINEKSSEAIDAQVL